MEQITLLKISFLGCGTRTISWIEKNQMKVVPKWGHTIH